MARGCTRKYILADLNSVLAWRCTQARVQQDPLLDGLTTEGGHC